MIMARNKLKVPNKNILWFQKYCTDSFCENNIKIAADKIFFHRPKDAIALCSKYVRDSQKSL